MKKKNIFILSCLSIFMLGACKGNSAKPTSSDAPTSMTPTHTHTFSDAWSSDDQYHWHASTCGHDVVKDKAEHTMNENGFCSVCNRYLGATFAYENQLGYYDFIHQQMDMTENQKYYCRIGGGHSGHKIYFEDGDPSGIIFDHITGYVFINNEKIVVNLSYETPSNLVGDDGYLYILLDAAGLSGWQLNDVWFRICEEHIEGDLVPAKLDYLGICPICGEFRFPNNTKNHDVHFSSPGIYVGKNKYTYYRIPITEDSEYGLSTEFNDVIGTEGKAEAFIVHNNAPVLLQTGRDYEKHLLHVEESDDKYLYLVFSYVGSPNYVYLEDTVVTKLTHGCDSAGWFYGKSRSDFTGTFDLEDEDYKINGKYVVGIDIAAPEDYGYKFVFDGLNDGDLATLKVYQANGAAVNEILPDSSGYYIGVSAEDLILEFTSAKPGSQIDVEVIEHTF